MHYRRVTLRAKKAVELGYRSIAIASLAQFELTERRTHIIGQWHGGTWGYGWMWDGQVNLRGRTEWVGITADWRLRNYQTKNEANLREYDLKAVQYLLGLIQLTPKEDRKGAVIISEDTGKPWVTRRYQEKFRMIARAAGISDEVLSMDMRSGGATEADSIPTVSDRMLQDSGGWRDPKMTQRYRRRPQDNAQKVVELRQAARDKS